jgi:hypothetical protein
MKKHIKRFPRLGDPGWPETLRVEAYQGIAGEIVNLIEPASESDPAALLLQFLTLFGNAIGPKAFYRVERTKHHANLFSLIVGQSAKSRKGTSFDTVRAIFEFAAPDWVEHCFHTGLSSGEGLIWAARDERERQKLPHDRRVFVIEPEFARVLRIQRRDGNTLSQTLRQAWDSITMQILTKNSPAKATGAHVSIVGHITIDELRRELLTTDQANGYANRLLFVCARRSKALPEGGRVDSQRFAQLAKRVEQARLFAKHAGEMKRSTSARKLWAQWYSSLSECPGMLGAITARAEAQVLRLSMLYALLDRSRTIRTRHLQAAIAVWRYCEDSARSIFRTVVGDKKADRIYAALLAKGEKGMSQSEIRALFSRNLEKDRIDEALELLTKAHLAECNREKTDGRPRTIWRVVH